MWLKLSFVTFARKFLQGKVNCWTSWAIFDDAAIYSLCRDPANLSKWIAFLPKALCSVIHDLSSHLKWKFWKCTTTYRILVEFWLCSLTSSYVIDFFFLSSNHTSPPSFPSTPLPLPLLFPLLGILFFQIYSWMFPHHLGLSSFRLRHFRNTLSELDT